MLSRPSWDTYFMSIAVLTKMRSNCAKRHVGCVIVKDNRVISLGYNGTPCGYKNCNEGGCERCNGTSTAGTNLDVCMCLHAEDNAIMFPSQTELRDSTIYVTLHPCISCAKKIIQCQVKRVVFLENYLLELDQISFAVLSESKVQIERYIGEVLTEVLFKKI